MTPRYKAIVSGLSKRDGETCDVIPRGEGLEAAGLGDDGFAPVLLRYTDMTVGLGGVDDRYIIFEGKHGDTPYKLMIGDHSVMDTLLAIGAPRPFLDAVKKTVERKTSRAAGRWALFGGLAAAIVLVVVALWLGFGAAVNRAVDLVPRDWEVSLGRTAAADVLTREKVCSDPALVAAMNEMGTRLIGALKTIPYDFRIRVLDTDDVNAFALPGGYLFVNRGLIDQADDSQEVAGVLAHEIQHAILRHGIHNIARQAGMMVLLSALVGDAGGVEHFLIYNAASLTSMSFSREQETAADVHGLDLMYRAGLDPTGLPRFLKKLAAKEGSMGEVLGLLSTHPASRERVVTLEEMIRQRGPAPVRPFKIDLSRLKNRCDAVTLEDPDAPL